MSWVYRRPTDFRPSSKVGHGFRVIAYAAGVLSGTAANTFGESATLRGVGALAGVVAIDVGASAIPTSTNPNELIGVAAITFGESALLRGAGALAASEQVRFANSATPSGTNAYQPSSWAKKRKPDPIPWNYYQWDARRWTIFPYTVSSATAGIGSIALQGNGVLTATGRLIGQSAPRFTITGSVNAGGSLSGVAALTFDDGASTITGTASGSISGNGGFSINASGPLVGAGALYGPAEMDFGGSATWQTLVPPSGNSAMRFTNSGRLTNASAGAGVVTDIAFSTVDGMEIFFSA